MRVALAGATGRMGRAVIGVLEEEGLALARGYTHASDKARGRDLGELAGTGPRGLTAELLDDATIVDADVLIDFSSPAGTALAAEACARAGIPLISGTTGLDAATEARLDALAARVPVVHAPNMSVGVTILFHLAELATRLAGEGFDAEIVEMHHRLKVDAPSGTALRLAERVAAARGLVASEVMRHGRSGQVGPRTADEIGVMTLRGGAVVGEHTLHLASVGERLELTHRAQDRSIFARGAVRAARWAIGRAPGRYGMPDVLGLVG